jgi:hypothetical protein
VQNRGEPFLCSPYFTDADIDHKAFSFLLLVCFPDMDIVFQSGEEFNNISGKRKTKMSF